MPVSSLHVLTVSAMAGHPAISALDPKATWEWEDLLKKLAESFRGRVVDIQHDNIMVEVVGSEGKVEAFIDLMRPYGIVELARTGRIALARGTPPAKEVV